MTATRVEGYEILERLGAGGFGVVHKARQRTTGQLVAIKTAHLPPDADPSKRKSLVARFMREVELCARLHHPNVVQVIDAGEGPAGDLYTVFAFVPGRHLKDVLAGEGALAPAEAQHLLMQVLDALAAAHAQGVIHRDLKPANIMLTTGARRNAMVLDFGIGTLARGVQPDDFAQLTATAELLGTPGYAAPEQWRAREATPATDLFSWGLVFLETLTGRRCFAGNSAPEVLLEQLGHEPVAIPESLAGHPLGHLLREVTDKNIDLRPSDATALMRRLEQIDLRDVTSAELAANVPITRTPSFLSAWSRQTTRETSSAKQQVTVLCCHVHPSDALQELDDRQRDITSLVARCREVSAAHEGAQTTLLGRHALHVFGYPQPDEHDARRAARSALALREGERISIGIHTGVILAGVPEALALGDVPEVARRLAGAAKPGEVLMSDSTQRVLRASFVCEAAGLITEGGITTKAFRLLDAPSDTHTKTRSLAMCGRQRELDGLLQRWERARAAQGQCCLISGEAGIGKSRLAHELRLRIEEHPHTFLECRCAPETRDSPLAPIIELVERMLGRESASRDKLADLQTLLLRHGFELGEALPLLAELLVLALPEHLQVAKLAPDVKRAKTLELLTALVHGIADERPLVLVVEDLHWADATTLELLARITTTATKHPLLAIFTTRPGELPESFAAAMFELPLGRLGARDVEAMLAEITEGIELPPEVVAQISDRTDGVPLFVEELARALLESGALVQRGEVYELAQVLSSIELPTSLRQLLSARLERLGRAKTTAQVAAALGREMGVKLLAAVGSATPEELHEDLEHLQAAGLLLPKRKRGDQGYVFRHALIRDAAYESLSRSARQAIHARIAAVIEGDGFPELLAQKPELLAHHHASAGQLEPALRNGQLAASLALQRSANTEAVKHARRALEWLDAIADPRQRAELELSLQSSLSTALMGTQGFTSPEVHAAVDRCQVLLDSLDIDLERQPQYFPVLWSLVVFHHTATTQQQSRATGERLADAADRSGNFELIAMSHAALGMSCMVIGDLAAADASAQRALAHYRPEQHEPLKQLYALDARTFACLTQSVRAWHAGQPESALAAVEAALRWAKETKHAHSLSLGLHYRTLHCFLNHDFEQLGGFADEQIRFAQRHGFPMIEQTGHIFRGLALLDPTEIVSAIQVLEAVGLHLTIPLFRGLILSQCLARLERREEALAEIDYALARAAEWGEGIFVPAMHRLRGRVLLIGSANEVDAARQCFRTSLDIARTQGARMMELEALTELALLSETSEELDELRSAYTGFNEGLHTTPLRRALHAMDVSRAYR